MVADAIVGTGISVNHGVCATSERVPRRVRYRYVNVVRDAYSYETAAILGKKPAVVALYPVGYVFCDVNEDDWILLIFGSFDFHASSGKEVVVQLVRCIVEVHMSLDHRMVRRSPIGIAVRPGLVSSTHIEECPNSPRANECSDFNAYLHIIVVSHYSSNVTGCQRLLPGPYAHALTVTSAPGVRCYLVSVHQDVEDAFVVVTVVCELNSYCGRTDTRGYVSVEVYVALTSTLEDVVGCKDA